MAAKIKKEVKATVSTDADLHSKLTLAVPCLGVVFMAAMGTYASSPVVSANKTALYAFLCLAGLGAFWAVCTYMWKVTAGPKTIEVHPLIGTGRTTTYDLIKKVEVRNAGSAFMSYSLIHKNGRVFLRMYPFMTNCAAFLERLRKLGVKIVEV